MALYIWLDSSNLKRSAGLTLGGGVEDWGIICCEGDCGGKWRNPKGDIGCLGPGGMGGGVAGLLGENVPWWCIRGFGVGGLLMRWVVGIGVVRWLPTTSIFLLINSTGLKIPKSTFSCKCFSCLCCRDTCRSLWDWCGCPCPLNNELGRPSNKGSIEREQNR